MSFTRAQLERFGVVLPSRASPPAAASNRRRGGSDAQRAGRRLEDVVRASVSFGSCVRLVDLPPAGMKFLAGGRRVGMPMPCDFLGCLAPSGRMIAFDAKSVGPTHNGLRLYDEKIVKHRQRDELYRLAQAGAVAGLLVEAKAANAYLWMPAVWLLRSDSSSVRWDDMRWLPLGDTSRLIDFAKLELIYRTLVEGAK